ncbi:MAG: cytochrome P460 family protein [Candidatus Kapabacteria bacterium]|nr:cytochrome P460 family protein [Candidatus Kapabacteria bacterium]
MDISFRKAVLTLSVFTFISFNIGCSKDEEVAAPAQEFVAADADIANYSTWTKTAENLEGPDPAGLIGAAHEANNMDVRRTVFLNKPNNKSNGKWANGTILVKEMRHKDGRLLAAMGMVKRGASFNTTHNGWEWFIVKDGKIADRAAGLMDGMCNGCHSSSKDTYDYVFTKK